MEEVINKSDGQFKVILDEIVDFNKHSSEKDPLIKELTRPPTSPATTSQSQPAPSSSSSSTTQTNNNKPLPPAASLNSSTYSSAASSSSSSTASTKSSNISSSSSSSTTSSSAASSDTNSNSDSSSNSSTATSSTTSASDSSTSSTSSVVSSTSSSPSQSCTSPGTSAKDARCQNGRANGKLEMPKMEDQGKKAEILENFRSLPSSKLTASSCTSINNTESTANKSSNSSLSQTNPAQRYATLTSSHVQLNGHGIASTSGETISESNTWKTINGKRDKRRKKPAERKILAEDIPGYIGDRTVEELAKFIESGTTGTSNSSGNKNNKNKLQNNSNGTTNNSNHHNIGSNNTNSSSSNPSNKKNDSHPLNNNSTCTTSVATNNHKTHLMSSKMTNNIQSKNPPQSIQSQQPSTANTTATTTNNNTTPNSNNSISSAVTSQNCHKHQIQPKQPQNQGDSYHEVQSNNNKNSKPLQQAQQHPKYSTNLTTRQLQPCQQRRIHQSVNQQHQQPQQQQPQLQPKTNQLSEQKSQAPQTSQNQDKAAVTFANHIKICDEDVNQYVFGFFNEEQPNQTQQTKITESNSLQNSHANNSKKQTSQVQKPIQNEHKQKSKQSKTSPISEENCYKSNDKIDANSFNYEQIYKFISNSWEKTKTRKGVASLSH